MPTQEDNSVTPGTDALEALERFVVENDDLLALESLIGRFNIFDALGITRAEIRHSNFLAFILDPAESHGQGQLFLKAVLMDLLKQSPPERRPLSPIDLDGTDLRGVEVKREWKHIDLLIRCQEPPFVVVIENKIGSTEGRGQLIRYEEAMSEHYPDARSLYVYLTLNADEASEDAWVPYSYEDIHRVLKRVRDTYRNSIGEDVLVFLDHYLHLIGNRFMNNQELEKLCQKIYKTHRQALRLIWDRVGKTPSGVLAEVETVLQEDPRWEVVGRPSKCLDFMPKAWLEWLPRFAQRGDDPRVWIYVRLWSDERRLAYGVELAPMTDAAKRIEIGTKLLNESSRCGFKPSKPRSVRNNNSRISALEGICEWQQDEPDSLAIRASVKTTLDDLYPKLERLALVLKPMCNLPSSAT